MPFKISHLLSFDVEEYFQVEAAAFCVRPETWELYEKRLAPCIERILTLLERNNASATFFILGWVAKHEPDVVRQIVRAGHEIACHGMNHQMLIRQTRQSFHNDILESRKILEDIAGKPILGYRAPTFSITRQTAWAIDILSQSGFLYDSSVFPIRHDRYGVPDSPRYPYTAVGPQGGTILEIPPLTLRLLGTNWPVGGGGYLRLFPLRCVTAGLEQAQSDHQPGMIYLHPWEIDPGQPKLPMNRLASFRHRVNLAATEKKLNNLLERYSFSSVQTFLQKPDMREYPKFPL